MTVSAVCISSFPKKEPGVCGSKARKTAKQAGEALGGGSPSPGPCLTKGSRAFCQHPDPTAGFQLHRRQAGVLAKDARLDEAPFSESKKPLPTHPLVKSGSMLPSPRHLRRQKQTEPRRKLSWDTACVRTHLQVSPPAFWLPQNL